MTAPSDFAARLRALPAIDRVLELLGDRPGATAAARALLDELREAIRGEAPLPCAPSAEGVAAELRARLSDESAGRYPRVVNATGVLLHTGLGRAPLGLTAASALQRSADGYCRLEVDAEQGEREDREAGLLPALLALTGAPAATVVNNNAAALLLVLRALGNDREVIVSRGELIEIGGGFRLPELMGLSGAQLVEVGTTNRTYTADYAAAITDRTALLLAVHTSNYRVVGFQHSPPRDELVALARERGLPLVEDVGSGLLQPGSGPLEAEPAVRTAVEAGVDLVLFSGDKLLGGPQAGILVGDAKLVAACRRDPLFRALRPGRLTLTALAATLTAHRDAPEDVPVTAALARSPRARLEQARELALHLERHLGASRPGAVFTAVVSEARVGSGSSPGREVKSAAVEIEWPDADAETLARALRTGSPPVYTRIWRDRLRLDVLGLRPGDDERLVRALQGLA